MNMTTFNSQANYLTYDNSINKPINSNNSNYNINNNNNNINNSNNDNYGKIFYLSGMTNNLNDIERDNNTYNVRAADRCYQEASSAASTSRLVVNNYEIIGNETNSTYTINNYSESGKLLFYLDVKVEHLNL